MGGREGVGVVSVFECVGDFGDAVGDAVGGLEAELGVCAVEVDAVVAGVFVAFDVVDVAVSEVGGDEFDEVAFAVVLGGCRRC